MKDAAWYRVCCSLILKCGKLIECFKKKRLIGKMFDYINLPRRGEPLKGNKRRKAKRKKVSFEFVQRCVRYLAVPIEFRDDSGVHQ